MKVHIGPFLNMNNACEDYIAPLPALPGHVCLNGPNAGENGPGKLNICPVQLALFIASQGAPVPSVIQAPPVPVVHVNPGPAAAPPAPVAE